MLAVARRRIGLAAIGAVLGALLISGGYRFGPAQSGGWSALGAGFAIVAGWTLIIVVAFMIVVPALLPHK